MNIFYILNILTLILLMVYKPVYLTKYFKFTFINPFTIIFMLSFPVLLLRIFAGPSFMLENGIWNKYFHYAILMTNLSLTCELCLIIGVLYFLKRNHALERAFFRLKTYKIKREKLFISGMVFFTLAVICFVLLANHSYGLINWILNPRDGYQYHRTGAGHFWLLSITFLSTAFVLQTLSFKKLFPLFFAGITYIFLSAFLGSKGIIIQFATYLIILLWIKRVKNLNWIIPIFLPAILALILYNYYLSFKQLNVEVLASYFDSYVNAASYYQGYLNHQIPLFHGKVFLTDFWSLVPRVICQSKPNVYGILLVNDIFFPGAAELTHTPSFGGKVFEFADFGALGVILLSLFNLFTVVETMIIYLVYKNLELTKILNNQNLLFLFVLTFAPGFLFNINFPLNILFFFAIIIIISILNRLRFQQS